MITGLSMTMASTSSVAQVSRQPQQNQAGRPVLGEVGGWLLQPSSMPETFW